jgi:hypothetical protein
VTAIGELLVAIFAIGLAWWFLRRLRRPVEPVEEQPGDPFAPVLAPRKGSPADRAASVAIEEPDEDTSADAFPPRTLED